VGYVVDKWTVSSASGRRVKGPRYGRGKRWLARWDEPGGTAKSKAFTTKDAAAAHLAQVDVDVRGGTYVARSDITFEEYARTWLARQVHHRPNTAAQAESRLRLHAYPVIGHLRLDQVSRGQVQDLVAASSLAPASVEVVYTYVRAVFASAVEDRLLSVSPCRRIRLPEVQRRRLDPLTAAEVGKAAVGVPVHLEAMVWVGAGSGLRPGELRSLTVDRVAGGVLVVDRQLTDATRAASVVWGPLKNDASYRSVPLASSTRARLEEHLERFPPRAHGLVFASARGAPLRRSQLEYAWQACGARGRGWHELRHHHASLLIAAGLSPRAVADRLGHADPSETLRTYSHLWPSDPERIFQAIEGVYGN
jgi:integrase